ncbi:hypothetical protein BKA83DRAFT_4227829 [Pisolithus microcarpus]|nr:hypothetical protein BKA83DRAFT_4227829 [Pisolithus microcarpus]
MRTTVAIFYTLLIIVQASDLAQSAYRNALLNVGVQKEAHNVPSTGKLAFQSAGATRCLWPLKKGMVVQRAASYSVVYRGGMVLTKDADLGLWIFG